MTQFLLEALLFTDQTGKQTDKSNVERAFWILYPSVKYMW